MLNHSASLAMSISILKALPGKLDIKDTHLVFSIDASHASLLRIISRGLKSRMMSKVIFEKCQNINLWKLVVKVWRL